MLLTLWHNVIVLEPPYIVTFRLILTTIDPADVDAVESVTQFVGGRLQLDDEVFGAGSTMRVKRKLGRRTIRIVVHVMAVTDSQFTQQKTFTVDADRVCRPAARRTH